MFFLRVDEVGRAGLGVLDGRRGFVFWEVGLEGGGGSSSGLRAWRNDDVV